MTKKNLKRRDIKNRVLRTGESQRSDGLYRYKYVDIKGQTHDIYSWRLEATDPLPAGKRKCEALREMEKQIEADKTSGIIPQGGNLTVVQLCTKYLAMKNNITENTRSGHKTVMNVLKAEDFGSRRIDTISEIDAMEFLVHLQQEKGKSYSSIHTIRGVLRPAFEMAVKNDLIRKNPFNWPIADVLVDDSVRREAVSRRDEKRFLDFIKTDKCYSKYYDAVFILFKTGMRISEFCGLTLNDVDLSNREINIDHQLQRNREGVLYIHQPTSKKALTKTPAGERVFPMTEEVYQAFRRVVDNRKKLKIEPTVDGYSGFLFFNQLGSPCCGMDWEHRFQHMVARFNKIYREPLPKITPHVCRHTFANNMANAGMNPTALQYLMGHSDISVTLGTYTHTKKADAKAELDRMALM